MNKEITVIVNKLSNEVDNFNYAIFEDKHDQLIKEVIEVSEKFAIKFAVWITFNCAIGGSKDGWYIYKNQEWKTSDELLEIYKKEQE